MQQLPDGLKYFDSHGPVHMTIKRCIKDDPRQVRRVYEVELNSETAILKLQCLDSLHAIWQTMRGRSYPDHEAAMLADADAAGLLVPKCLGQARRRRLGVIVEHGLILRFFPDATSIRNRLMDVQQHHDDKAMHELASQMVDMMTTIRQAGFADRDFGVHNLLLLEDGATVWTDLERSYHAPPSCSTGSIQTAGSALASWWVSTTGDQKMLQQTFEQIIQRLPQPENGWSAALMELNRYTARKVQRFIDIGWYDQLPEALILDIDH